jgi:hypothetical protein
MNKQHHKCTNTGGHHYDLTTIEKKGETSKEIILKLKETVSILTATCQQVHNDRQTHVEAICHKRNKQKYDKEYEFYTATQTDEHCKMTTQNIWGRKHSII